MAQQKQRRSKRVEPGPDFISDHLSYLLARSSVMLARDFHEKLRASGQQSAVFKVIGAMPPDQGLSISELVKITLLQQPTLTKTVMRLQDAGLVEKRVSPDDGRLTLVFLTEEGKHLARELVNVAAQNEEAVLAQFDPRVIKRLKKDLGDLLKALERPLL